MAYGNYAPFYRTGYFNPLQTQTMPNMMDVQNQFGPQYQAPIQNNIAQMPQLSNDTLWVLNETEAISYPVALNNSVILWDKNQPTVYIKSVNMQGIPSMRILDYTERSKEKSSEMPEKHTCKCGNEFVGIDDFKSLQGEFETLKSELQELKQKPKSNEKEEA